MPNESRNVRLTRKKVQKGDREADKKTKGDRKGDGRRKCAKIRAGKLEQQREKERERD